MLPGSLVEVAIEAKSASDAERLAVALARLAATDSHFSFGGDKESGLYLIGGLSDLHLDMVIEQLRDGEGGQFNVGALQVAYRERLTRAVRIDNVHKRFLGPKGEFARVVIDFTPAMPGSGFTFENRAGAAVPAEFVPSVERGLKLASENGVLAGFPLIDFTAVLVDSAHHNIDSSPRAFQIAAQGAVRDLKERGDVRLVEPIMRVEVRAPDEFINVIVSDLGARRGVILDRRSITGSETLIAEVPMANTFGYTNTLTHISQRRARHTMQFAEYREVPDPDGHPPFPPAVGMRA